MRPTPRKLALLMAVAGLGLSLGEAAQAKQDPLAAAGVLGWIGPSEETSDLQGAPAMAGWASLPAGRLDATLMSAEVAPVPSEEDRAAIALAMVLMADVPSPAATTWPIPGVVTSARWEPSADFRRDFGPGERAAEPPMEPAQVAAGTAEGDDAAPSRVMVAAAVPSPAAAIDLDLTAPAGVDINLGLTPALDLDLSSSPGLDLNQAMSPSPGLDVDLDLSARPDLDLDLNLSASLNLDLNLDLSPSLDLSLDRPPVFPITRLRPAGIANQPGNARAAASPREPVVADVRAASHPSRIAAPAVTRQARPAEPLPTIVVASHADRVMLSLEALLANDDPRAGGFGALPEQVIVSSHAEKALATLAAICRRGDAELADLRVVEAPAASTTAEGTAPLTTAASSTATEATTPSAIAAAEVGVGGRAPGARPETARRAARRSALGDDLVAVHEGSLDKVRGGFDAPNGLQISFGIERAVYINGSLVTTTSFNVGDLAKVVGGQAAVSAAVAGSRNLTLVQNGAGNTFVTGPVSAATVGTVIQNTLNDQKIQSVTSINATVNSLQMMKAQNFEASMRGALTDALRR